MRAGCFGQSRRRRTGCFRDRTVRRYLCKTLLLLTRRTTRRLLIFYLGSILAFIPSPIYICLGLFRSLLRALRRLHLTPRTCCHRIRGGVRLHNTDRKGFREGVRLQSRHESWLPTFSELRTCFNVKGQVLAHLEIYSNHEQNWPFSRSHLRTHQNRMQNLRPSGCSCRWRACSQEQTRPTGQSVGLDLRRNCSLLWSTTG